MAASFQATHFILSWPWLPFSLDFDELLLVLGLDGLAFVAHLIILPGETHRDSAKLKHHSGAQAASGPVCSYLTLHLQEPLGQDLRRLSPRLSALRVVADFNVALMTLFDSILLWLVS